MVDNSASKRARTDAAVLPVLYERVPPHLTVASEEVARSRSEAIAQMWRDKGKPFFSLSDTVVCTPMYIYFIHTSSRLPRSSG